MVTWELIAMMLIPFVMFGVFAAVGVLLVKNSKEVGLRVIGYAVTVVFGVVALGMPVVVFVTIPAGNICYDSRGLRVPCSGEVVFIVSPEAPKTSVHTVAAPTFDRVECFRDGVRVLCWPNQRLQ